MIAQLLIFLSLLTYTAATTGVDVSQRTSLSSWQCIRNYGYEFAIVRVYQSNGVCDSNGPLNINDAWSAGMAHVDGYIFPCYSCGNPAGQIDATVNYLASHSIRMLKVGEPLQRNGTLGATIGMLWLDVEGTQYWSSSTDNNVNFIASMLSEGKARGINMGIYSSASQWNPITGGTTKFSTYPIWYAHYDLNPSFSDFSAFGGWTKPAIKQYAGDQSFCSAGVDKNFY